MKWVVNITTRYSCQFRKRPTMWWRDQNKLLWAISRSRGGPIVGSISKSKSLYQRRSIKKGRKVNAYLA